METYDTRASAIAQQSTEKREEKNNIIKITSYKYLCTRTYNEFNFFFMTVDALHEQQPMLFLFNFLTIV